MFVETIPNHYEKPTKENQKKHGVSVEDEETSMSSSLKSPFNAVGIKELSSL